MADELIAGLIGAQNDAVFEGRWRCRFGGFAQYFDGFWLDQGW
jgi:hypothetical protein